MCEHLVLTSRLLWAHHCLRRTLAMRYHRVCPFYVISSAPSQLCCSNESVKVNQPELLSESNSKPYLDQEPVLGRVQFLSRKPAVCRSPLL